MSNTQEELYAKYMEVHSQMLQDYDPLELAAVLMVQSLSMYKTLMPEDDYLAMVDSIYESRHDVKTFTGPALQ